MAAYPIVVLMFLWPAMTWAMCGGRPLRIASVMNILQKSWGWKSSGCPELSVIPEALSVSSRALRSCSPRRACAHG